MSYVYIQKLTDVLIPEVTSVYLTQVLMVSYKGCANISEWAICHFVWIAGMYNSWGNCLGFPLICYIYKYL